MNKINIDSMDNKKREIFMKEISFLKLEMCLKSTSNCVKLNNNSVKCNLL